MFQLQVFVEDINKTIILKVASQQIVERAKRDPVFLRRLCDIQCATDSNETISNSLETEVIVDSNETISNSLETEVIVDSNETISNSLETEVIVDSNETISNSLETEVIVDSNENVSSIYIWTDACVLLLLTLYEEHESDFQESFKRRKEIWDTIAAQMKSKGYDVTGPQCQSKLNSLKRTYKKIIDHNSTSGNERKIWPHFERMNDIFGSNAWVRPKAVATEAGPSCTAQKTRKGKSVLDALESAIEESKKRRVERNKDKNEKIQVLIAQKERHHKEKMALLQTIINQSISK